MARLAIFMDGGYVDKIARRVAGVSVDYGKLVKAVHDAISDSTPEPVDLLRTFWYYCAPYQSNPPSEDEKSRYANFRKFERALMSLPRFEVRLGRLQHQGLHPDGNPKFGQKQVDLLLGLDIALLSGKQQITHAALLAGDSDFVPALKLVKQEGVSAWLFHGPAIAPDGRGTYAQELWVTADDRFEMDQGFWSGVQRQN